MFLIRSHTCMARIDDDSLSLHLEIALAGAAPELLEGLANPDRYRRRVAVAEIARHLAERLRCFDIRCEEAGSRLQGQASLFPDNMRLIYWSSTAPSVLGSATTF
jgi:hypothetical protein